MADPASQDHPFTRKERIQELASIEKDVTSSLMSASKAIRALTGHPASDPESHDMQSSSQSSSPEQARSAFEQHTKEYMTHVQAVNARLKRQIYALEEAGIIPATAKDEDTLQQQASAPRRSAPAVNGLMTTAPPKDDAVIPITNGGLGNFDVGWLNSKRDHVGKQKEAELWAEARFHLELMHQSKRDTDDMELE